NDGSVVEGTLEGCRDGSYRVKVGTTEVTLAEADVKKVEFLEPAKAAPKKDEDGEKPRDPEKPDEKPAAEKPAASESDAEAALREAVDIVQARDVAKYPKALAALERIPAGSRYYEDAQGYKTWIHCDTLVREGTALEKKGDADGARAKYEQAL